MKIVVAIDSYKGSASSRELNEAVRSGYWKLFLTVISKHLRLRMGEKEQFRHSIMV